MDGDKDGYISKQDWRAAFAIIGPDFPTGVVDSTFDAFDPDGSGEVEFKELDAFLRRRGSIDKKVEKKLDKTIKMAKVAKLEAAAASSAAAGSSSGDAQKPKAALKWQMASLKAVD